MIEHSTDTGARANGLDPGRLPNANRAPSPALPAGEAWPFPDMPAATGGPVGHDAARSPDGGKAGARPGRGSLATLAADPAALADLRRMVEETPLSLRRIAGMLGVPSGTLWRAVRSRGWRRPQEAPKAPRRADGRPVRNRPRPKLAAGRIEAGAVGDRLVRVIDRQVFLTETRLMRAGARIEEKDARILSHLAKTLTILTALDGGRGAAQTLMEPVDREALNADLARRIARWARGGAEPG